MLQNDNAETAQCIVNAIERDECVDVVEDMIVKADNYLLYKNSDIPGFLDEFFIKAESILKTTVNGCVKARNNHKKKDDLRKYREGYFNEIIQNANDVVSRTKSLNPSVHIECERADNTYTVICSYPDIGFSLTDIYGFCSRGNSNKSSEKGQEGIYGIGIKSLFCFVTYFCIENNIKIELSSTEGQALNNISVSLLGSLQDEPVTTVTFKFEYDKNNVAINNHAGFCIKKLADFIDDLYENKDVSAYFEGEDAGKTLFDIRSLIFSELKKGRTAENSIKKISVTANGNKVMLQEKPNVYTEDDKRLIKLSTLNNMTYLVFHYSEFSAEDDLSIAYAVGKDWDSLNDRLYATYFVSTYSAFLNVPTGCLVNTKAINSSRSGLERESEAIEPAILQKIREKGSQTVIDLIKIINNQDNEAEYREAAGDVLCQLLYRFRLQQTTSEDETYPSGIFAEMSDKLRTLFLSNKLLLGEGKTIVFKKNSNDEIDYEQKIIRKNKPVLADEDNCKAVFNVYWEMFVKNELIFFHDTVGQGVLTAGIEKLCGYYFLSGRESWLSKIGIPFIASANELIVKRIGGDTFERITAFIQSNQRYELFIKQIAARFEINDGFDYMGKYSDKNIVNWIFTSKIAQSDRSFKEKCREYEEAYSDFKNLISNKIHTVDRYEAWNNFGNASSDLFYSEYKVSSYDTVYENQISQFLNMLHRGIFHNRMGFNRDSNRLHIQNTFMKNVILRNNDYNGYKRRRSTRVWDGDYKYFTLDFLDRIITNFENFKLFRSIIDEYNEKYGKYHQWNIYRIKYLTKCNIKSADMTLLTDVFKWLSTYSEGININVSSLESCGKEDTHFTKFVKILIPDINIRLDKIEASKHGSHFVGYIANIHNGYSIRIRRKKGDAEFTSISDGSLNSTDAEKQLIIFYSGTDEQSALSNVLRDLYGKADLPEYANSFINIDNVKQLSSKDYNKYLKRGAIKHVYPFEIDRCISMLPDVMSLTKEDIYEMLCGEMSYGDHCPICNEIPTLNIKGAEKISESKNCLVVIIPAIYKGTTIYVKIICCKSCFEEYKVSLSEASVLSTDKGHELILKNTICDSFRSYDFVKSITLSPDNWIIIEAFNRLKTELF